MTWFDAAPGAFDGILPVLAGISRDQWAWLAIALAVAALSALSRRAALARSRRLAEADANAAVPEILRVAREVGFESFAVQWTVRGTAVVLTLWGEDGSLTAIGRGNRRSVAALAALAAIVAVLPPAPAPYPGSGAEGAWAGTGAGAGDRPDADPARSGPMRGAPAPDWWREALGLAPGATRAEADRAWRTLAKAAHPDRGGSAEAMARLNAARDEARRVLGQGGLTSGAV